MKIIDLSIPVVEKKGEKNAMRTENRGEKHCPEKRGNNFLGLNFYVMTSMLLGILDFLIILFSFLLRAATTWKLMIQGMLCGFSGRIVAVVIWTGIKKDQKINLVPWKEKEFSSKGIRSNRKK